MIKYQINLFQQSEKKILDKVVHFAINYLRYILVITQFVAIVVFFFRFRVDQEIVDLKDKLNNKQSILVATQNLLTHVKKLDTQIKKVSGLLDIQDNFQMQFNYINSKIPEDIQVTSMSYTKKSVIFFGQTKQIESVKKIFENLQSEKRFKKVELSNIDKSEKNYTFSLLLTEFQK